MDAIKKYDINIPEICINGIIKEIDRNSSVDEAVTLTTISKDMELQKLKKEMCLMQEQVEKAEATAASQRRRFWQK
jgi:hypothetical protein